VTLTLYIGLTGLPLGVEGVEFLLQPFLALLARIDGAAQLSGVSALTHSQPLGLFYVPLLAGCAAR
jgi:hypothetical protein